MFNASTGMEAAIYSALDHFAATVGAAISRDPSGCVTLSRTDDTYSWLSTVIDDGTGFSAEICDEWNAHVDRMLELYDELQRDEGEPYFVVQTYAAALDAEIDKALADVARVANRVIFA